MASTDVEGDTSVDGEPWLAFCDDEDHTGDPKSSDLLMMMKDLLLSRLDTVTVKDTAKKIDDYYSKTYLKSDELMKYRDDKGMEDYIATIYWLIFDLAQRLSHKDPRQDILVQLIVELRGLVPKKFTIWGVGTTFINQHPPAYSII